MRRAGVLGAVVALALAAGAVPANAAAPSLTEVTGARFPEREYALTLGAPRPLTADDVQVRENGRVVPDVDVVPAERSGSRPFGVVLAIDSSGSMHGRPLEAAQAAARAFVRHRSPAQPIAVITFAGDVRVVQPFTTDSAEIERAVESVAPGAGTLVPGTSNGRGGSHILDAGAQAVSMIEAAHMTSGSAIVLSDGADYGSRATVADVSAAAQTAGARVYSVGLNSSGTDFGTLNLLAAGTSGEFSAVDSLNDLARVYDRLGSQLAHQYLVRYRSAASPGTGVDVEVRVDGVPEAAHAGYAAPSVPHDVGDPFHRTPLEAFWAAPGASLLTVALIAALIALAAWALVRPRVGSLRARLAAFVSPPSEGDADAASGVLSDRLFQGAERSLERQAWWAAFKERMDVGRIKIAPARLVVLVAVGTMVLFALLALLGGNPAFGLLALVLPLGTRMYVARRAARQRKLFGEQLPDNLQVIASAMRAGHSFGGALSVVVDDAPEPTRRELQRVIADERLGVSLETALGVVVRRMDNKDLQQVALVASLQRETGGNTAEVLDRVTETVRERMALQRTVATLTAQGRMSRWVLTALPCVLLAVITLVNPAYVEPLFGTMPGRVLLGLAAGMVCAGSFVIGRIVDIKV
jgi:tight adherence protein B